MIVSRIAVSDFGDWFTDEEEYMGYAPLAALSVIALIISGLFSSVFAIWAPVLWVLAVALPLWAAAGSLTLSRGGMLNTSSKEALQNYYGLTKAERKQMPDGIGKLLLKNPYNRTLSSEVNKSVQVIEARRPLDTTVAVAIESMQDHRKFLEEAEAEYKGEF